MAIISTGSSTVHHKTVRYKQVKTLISDNCILKLNVHVDSDDNTTYARRTE